VTGTIKMTEGSYVGLRTIARKDEADLTDEGENKFKLRSTVVVPAGTFHATLTATLFEPPMTFTATAEGTVKNTLALLEASYDKDASDPNKMILDRLTLVDIGVIDINVEGLGDILEVIVPKAVTDLKGHLRRELLRHVENDLKDLVQEVIRTGGVPLP